MNGKNTPPNIPNIEVVENTQTCSGDFTNNRGLVIKEGGRLEIFGDLTSYSTIIVEDGGILIVYGDLICPGTTGPGTDKITINGTLIVLGSGNVGMTKIDSDNGNMVVGGDFSSDKVNASDFSKETLYILDPSVTPDPSNIDYGNGDDFDTNEEGSVVHDLVKDLGLLHARCIWNGETSSNWTDTTNWIGGVPVDTSSVEIIELAPNQPVISKDSVVNIANVILGVGRTLDIEAGASLNVSGNVINHGTLVLESTSDQLASLMLPSNPSKAGEVNVKLTLEKDHYWYMSSPVKNATAQWFNPDNLSDDKVYLFRVVNNRWQWLRLDDSNASLSLDPMEGVVAYFRNNSKELDFSGEVYNSDVTKAYDERGFYLLGNPFPTAIDWDNNHGWVREGFSNTIWSWIDYNGFRIIQTYNNGGDGQGIPALVVPEGYDETCMSHIAPYQSVWIKLEDNSGTLTVKREARIGNSNAPLKSASMSNTEVVNMIRIKVANDYSLDGSVLYFNDRFSDGIGNEDSEKRFNGSKKIPEVYTRNGNMAMAINGLPALNEEQYHFPLSVRNRVEGAVTLSVNLDKFDGAYSVFLEDVLTQTTINLRENSEYVYTPEKMGDTNDRFVLHIQKVPTSVDNPIMQPGEGARGIAITGNEQYVRVEISPDVLQQNSGKAMIEVLDMNGRLLNQVVACEAVTKTDLPRVNGVCVVRVAAGMVVKSEKLVVKNR